MEWLTYSDGTYRSPAYRPSLIARAFPALSMYAAFIRTVFRANALVRHGQYDDMAWARSTHECLELVERVGISVEITGIGSVAQLDTPCVIISNHMSALETVVLPFIVTQFRPVTFIVKHSLLTYPVFGPILRSREPIGVTRTNPRQDLKAVLEQGADRLGRGISIVVFPQTTRTVEFDPAQFTSIGVKLAQRARVPVVPLALLSDAWGNGSLLKDFGPVDPARDVHFAFGEPLRVQGRGAEEHQEIIRFISAKLAAWRRDRAAPDHAAAAGDPA